jgi:GAF domain-containing protein
MVLLIRDRWLTPVASDLGSRPSQGLTMTNGHAATSSIGPLALGDPTLTHLAPLRAIAERRTIDGDGQPAALWPLLARPHLAIPLQAAQDVVGVLVTAAVEDGPTRAALEDLATLAASALRPGSANADPDLLRLAHLVEQLTVHSDHGDCLAQAIAVSLGASGAVLLALDADQRRHVIGRAGISSADVQHLPDAELRWVLVQNAPRQIAVRLPGWPAAMTSVRAPQRPQVLLWPVTHRGRAIGVLALVDPATASPLAAHDTSVLRVVSAVVAVAIGSAVSRAAQAQTSAQRDAVIERSQDAITIVDQQQRLVGLNQAARALWGLTNQAVGLPLATSLPPMHLSDRNGQTIDRSDLPLLQALRCGHRYDARLSLQRGHAPRRSIESQALVLLGADGGQLGALALDHDITLRAAQERLAAALAALATLDSAAVAVSTIAREAVVHAAEAMEVDGATIWLMDRAGRHLRLEATHGVMTDQTPALLALDDDGPITEAARTRTLHVIETSHDDHVDHGPASDAAATTVATVLVVPLLARGGVTGVLTLLTRHPRHVDDDEIECAQQLAHVIALMLAVRLSVGDARRS